MLMNFNMDKENGADVCVKVVGVGGGGGNAVNRMIDVGVSDVEFIVVNTDKQVLESSRAKYKLQLGEKLTRGMGAGGDPSRGERAAEESRDEIATSLKGANMIFITAGMGGGTGTGAAPIVAEIARDMGILTVAVVTKPFEFEGMQKMLKAEAGIAKLLRNVDSLLVIPNERLLPEEDDDDDDGEDITMIEAFRLADDVVRKGVQSISELIRREGELNLDFADVQTVMKDAGYAHMGVGEATGKDRAQVASKLAIESPLLEGKIDGARRAILNVTVSSNVSMKEIKRAAKMVQELLSESVNLKWGAMFDESMADAMRVTIIATDFEEEHVDFDIPDYTFKSSMKPGETTTSYMKSMGEKASESAEAVENTAEQAEAVTVPAKEDAPTELKWDAKNYDDDDDRFAELMAFFNKGK